MDAIERAIRSSGLFLRRRDLLARGFSDRQIRWTLGDGTIFRVRHGWYSVPDAPEPAIRAVRTGGRLTSISALESYGLRVPRTSELHVAVVATASRLRSPDDRWVRLRDRDQVHVHWVDRRGSGGNAWRVSLEDALLAVLIEQPRDVAIACCSAVARHAQWSTRRLERVFRRAPIRVQGWRALVSLLDESHGETFARLLFVDEAIPFTQQAMVAGAGRHDFQVGPHTYIEIDGAQHDPSWTGVGESTWKKDLDRAATVTIGGGTVLHFGYRQLYGDQARMLASIERAIADDAVLTAYRQRHPYRPPSRRKRRRSALQVPW